MSFIACSWQWGLWIWNITRSKQPETSSPLTPCQFIKIFLNILSFPTPSWWSFVHRVVFVYMIKGWTGEFSGDAASILKPTQRSSLPTQETRNMFSQRKAFEDIWLIFSCKTNVRVSCWCQTENTVKWREGGVNFCHWIWKLYIKNILKSETV